MAMMIHYISFLVPSPTSSFYRAQRGVGLLLLGGAFGSLENSIRGANVEGGEWCKC